MVPFGLPLFLGSCLAFLVQPLTAKALLPAFGGSHSVWVACLLVYQFLLLVGYASAHLLSRLRLRDQVIGYLLLLGAALLALPLSLPMGEAASGDLAWEVALALLGSVGLPGLALSCTMPLVQTWAARSRPTGAVYRLFALSNGAALLALLVYPFHVEPTMGLSAQARAWSSLFLLFGASAVYAAWHVLSTSAAPSPEPNDGATPDAGFSGRDFVWWVGLAATGTVLLAAATTVMAQDVAAVPLMWVAPLAMYLASFAIAFHHPRWYVRGACGAAFILSVLAMKLGFGSDMAIAQLCGYSVVVFSGSLICHGELARRRPAPGRLTWFTLAIAAGGVAGSALVAAVAPRVFDGYVEYDLVVSLIAIGWAAQASRGWPVEPRRDAWRWSGAVAGSGALMVLGLAVLRPVWLAPADTLVVRGLHGILRVRETNIGTREPVWVRSLWSGRILHGAQFLEPKLRGRPMLYYGPDSGVALAIAVVRRLNAREAGGTTASLRIGVVGTGVGAIAAYGQSGDLMRFYELDPDVARLAQQQFTFLRDSAATVETVLGDGRIALQQELAAAGSQRYDVLVVDAFTGDAIPVHLLTREAFALYAQHLSRAGVLAIHLSNRYLDLRPLVAQHARALKLESLWLRTPRNDQTGALGSQWLLLTGRIPVTTDYRIAARLVTPPASALDAATWTDDFSSVLGVLASHARPDSSHTEDTRVATARALPLGR